MINRLIRTKKSDMAVNLLDDVGSLEAQYTEVIRNLSISDIQLIESDDLDIPDESFKFKTARELYCRIQVLKGNPKYTMRHPA